MKTKLTLDQIREHNAHLKANKVGKYDEHQVMDSIAETLPAFAKEVYECRMGLKVDKRGNKIKPMDIPFHKAVNVFYGCDLKTFMRQVEIFSQTDTIADVATRFGASVFNKSTFEDLLIGGGSFGATMNTKDIASDFRFIIPEIIAAAIRIGYDGAAMSQNWIAMTQNMVTQKLVMPQLLRGDAVASRVNEGANIPVGSLKFGKKEVKVFKVGTGFSITDELVDQSTIDMLFQFLQEVGIEMSISSDVEALRVLVNGEQTDLSESAPVIGVESTSAGFAYKDIKRTFTRMNRLKNPATRLIANEADGIDVTAIDRFEGYQGETKLSSIRSIIGVPESFEIDTNVLPANQMMFISPDRAMAKLQYKSMMIERRRNPQNQTDELFVSDHVGFAILRRDARLLMDKSILFSGNGFPSYMDIDSRIASAFNNY